MALDSLPFSADADTRGRPVQAARDDVGAPAADEADAAVVRRVFAELHVAFENGDESALDRADALVEEDRIGPEDCALAYADLAVRYADGDGVPRDSDKMSEYAFLALKHGLFEALLAHPINRRLNLQDLLDLELLSQLGRR